jgi:hypothetical protein
MPVRPDRQLEDDKPKTSLDAGDFRADGSWNTSAAAAQRGPRYRFVQSLVRALQAAHISPAQLAERIEASEYAGMFGELEQWRKITKWDEWALAWTRTSADEAVKRMGVGSTDPAHWEKGQYVAGEDARPFVAANREHVASFVANIADKLTDSRPEWAGPAVTATPAPGLSDQEFFEGKAT